MRPRSRSACDRVVVKLLQGRKAKEWLWNLALQKRFSSATSQKIATKLFQNLEYKHEAPASEFLSRQN